MTKNRGQKTEIGKILSQVCHSENFKVRHADNFNIGNSMQFHWEYRLK